MVGVYRSKSREAFEMGQTSRKADFNDSNPLGRVFSSRREAVGIIGGRDCVGYLSHKCGGMRHQRLMQSRYRSLRRKKARRPLASRALTVQTGIGVALISLVCAAILAFYLNPLSFWLCVAAVPVIICYPLAKRVFPVPQLVLSIAWGFAVLISWSAVEGL